MLSLGTKLRFGVGSLLPITLALGTCGIVQVSRLGPAVDVILRENHRSVLAMERGTEAPEHQDTGALYALLGETESSTELRAEYSPVVETAIDTEPGNIALPGEQARAACLDSLYTIYQAVLYRALDASGPVPVREGSRVRLLLPRTDDDLPSGHRQPNTSNSFTQSLLFTP